MALFVKRTNTETRMPLFTLGDHKTLLIVGLGNVGKEYVNTRHNIGFICVDTFVQQQGFPGWVEKKDLWCYLTKQTIGDTNVIVIKPTTFMNDSGKAVQAVQHFFKVANSQMLIIHDELDIPFGVIKSKQGGGSAGHNGLKSIIQHCGEDFNRIRIGIRNEVAERADSADFVLNTFSKDEAQQLPKLQRQVLSLLNEYTASGTVSVSTYSFTDQKQDQDL